VLRYTPMLFFCCFLTPVKRPAEAGLHPVSDCKTNNFCLIYNLE